MAGDALRTPILASYDLVIANPPYGRVSLDDVTGTDWESISHSGHINKYALFAGTFLPGGEAGRACRPRHPLQLQGRPVVRPHARVHPIAGLKCWP